MVLGGQGAAGDVAGGTEMTVETGVFAYLSASHRDRLTGGMHGHTWKFTAWVNGDPPRDARVLKVRLETVLKAFDHTVLPDDLASAEALCRAIEQLLGDCTEVTAERAEGFLARWRP
jgi:6-pyruvoyl-tetrahydropterin synthase